MFAVFIRERDTSLAVVHLFTAEALVSRHEGLTGQRATGTVGRLGVVVVSHVVFPFKDSVVVSYAPIIYILST